MDDNNHISGMDRMLLYDSDVKTSTMIMALLHNHVPIYPKEYGLSDISKVIQERLKSTVIGMNIVSGDISGMIVDVIQIESIGDGYIKSGGGSITNYKVAYLAKLFSPKIDDMVYGQVTKITSQGLLVSVKVSEKHDIEFYISDREIPKPYVFSSDIFHVQVSSDLQIKLGSYVQFRISGIRMESSSLFGIGTMKGDYLGLLKK